MNPLAPLQQWEYDEMFSMSIESSSTGDKTYQDKSGRRLMQEDGDEEKDKPKLKFTVSVLSHSSKEMKFQLNFENAQLVSDS